MVKDYIRPRILCEIVLQESLEVVQKQILHMVCFILAPPCECKQYQRIPLSVYSDFHLISISERKKILKLRRLFFNSPPFLKDSVHSLTLISRANIVYSLRLLTVSRRDYEYFVWFSNQNERYFYNTSV